MPLYLGEAAWDGAAPLGAALSSLEELIQRTGGQVLQVLQLDEGLSVTMEAPDEVSVFRAAREAEALGLRLRWRPALSRIEAEALDRAHRARHEGG